MKQISKMLVLVYICCVIFVYGVPCFGMSSTMIYLQPMDSNGEKSDEIDICLYVKDFDFENDFFDRLEENNALFSVLSENDRELILSNAQTTDNILLVPVFLKEGTLEDDEEFSVSLEPPLLGGGRGHLFGKDYRIYYLNEGKLEENLFSYKRASRVSFKGTNMGIYVLYYNPAAYEVDFYFEKPEYDEDLNIVSDTYFESDNLKRKDAIIFPEIPQKENFVFGGWVYDHMQGSYNMTEYLNPEPYAALTSTLYPRWIAEDGYVPIEVTIESGQVVKGKENGEEITLKINEGEFEILEYNSEIDPDYTDPEYGDEILEEWKAYWNVVGNDEVIISKVEKIDARTLKLTLSGNSSEVHESSEIKIEFSSEFYNPYEYGDHIIYPVSEIQLDENGAMRKMFVSDNSVELKKQKRTSGGGGGSISYTVVFDEKGGSAVENQSVRKGDFAICPEVPKKEGFVFDGWYIDEECTKEYDFNASISGGVTLYAKWIEEEKPETKENNRIILTIGEKSAEVFGEVKENDVAPIIIGERAFLPARFVAESLGAVVEWDGNAQKVTITKDGVEIIITIGSKTAIVNCEEVHLDSPAFLENGRTYTPIRFVAERLGADVEWEESLYWIVITSK